jgi:hypothetical protein
VKANGERLEVVENLLLHVSPLLDRVSTVDFKTGGALWPLVAMCAWVRQHDHLETICHLVRVGRSYAAVPLLRPNCEDVIAIEFLKQLPPHEANLVIYSLTQLEVAQTLKAQRDFSGDDAMWKLGLELHFHVSQVDAALQATGTLR